MINAYGCDSFCVRTTVGGSIMERLMKDKEGTFNLCQCTNPFTFESDPLMVEDLMVAHNMVFKRSPDMELYNMMKVDTSAYKIDHNLLKQMKNDLTM